MLCSQIRCYCDICSPGECVLPNSPDQISLVISVPQTIITRARSFPLWKWLYDIDSDWRVEMEVLLSTQYVDPLPSMHHQQEGIPNCENLFNPLQQSSENWRTKRTLYMHKMPSDEREAGSELCFKCQEWFHDTCLGKAVPELYWTPVNTY